MLLIYCTVTATGKRSAEGNANGIYGVDSGLRLKTKAVSPAVFVLWVSWGSSYAAELFRLFGGVFSFQFTGYVVFYIFAKNIVLYIE